MSKFPVTHWPADPLSVPSMRSRFVTYHARDGLLFADVRTTNAIERELPAELYLRDLRRLDLTNDEAVAAFASEHGHVTVAPTDGEAIPYLSALIESRVKGLPVFKAKLRRVEAGRPSPSATIKGSEFIATLEEMRLAVRWLRDLTSIAVHRSRWEPNAESMAESLADNWQSTFARPPKGGEAAAQTLAVGVTAALRPLAPRLSADEPLALWGVPTYSLLALQLWNHVAEGAAFRECRMCHGLFVRQQGGSKRGQHRTRGELRYCSIKCANRYKTRKLRGQLPADSKDEGDT